MSEEIIEKEIDAEDVEMEDGSIDNEEEDNEDVENVEAKEEAPTVKTERKREERIGIAYIYSSYNNTIIHITDLAGNTLSRISGGMVTKHSRLKANPTTAMFVAKKAGERAKDIGITGLYVRVRAKTGNPGMGPGGHEAVKTLGKDFKIISIADTTKIPRGGPKKKGGKRGRRV